MKRVLVPVAALAACAPAPTSHAVIAAPTLAAGGSGAGPATENPGGPSEPMPDVEAVRQMALTRSFFLGNPQHATLTADGARVLFLRSAPRDPKQSLFVTDLASGTTRELVAPDAVLAGPETLSPEERVLRERMRVRATGFTSLDVGEDGSRALVTLSGRAFVVDVATGKSTMLATGEGAVIDPQLSPDGKRVAYVRDDDLYVLPLPAAGPGAPPTRLTHGGTERITHGIADFIAGEELSRARGFWWSPDGAHVLYEEADTTRVDVLTIADPARPERAPQRIAYPRPGRPNADLRFGIVAASGGATTWVQWDHGRFPYVAQVSWQKGAPPVIYVLDRAQQTGQLLTIDVATGKTTVLVEEKDAAWVGIDPSTPKWLADGSGFLWASDRSGEWRLELRDRAGKSVRDLLPNGFGYVDTVDVDDKTRTAVVIADADPTQALQWLVSLDGGRPPQLLGANRGVTSARFGKSHDRYVSHESSLEAPPRTVVRGRDGTLVAEIPSLAESPRELPHVELAQVGPDAVRVALVRPRGAHPGGRYAVIDAAYGGPHVNVVSQSVLTFARAQWMADATGAVVVLIDAQGTPRRGHDWERFLFRKLGSVPLDGHVAALRELGSRYPELDLSRVGVYGWSFGGYFAALAVLTRPDVYRAGVAGAPPADWRDYDTAYTERFLGDPDQDKAAYDAASLLTYAAQPPAPGAARPLLVLHGTADDNVWFLNSLKLTDALERGGRPFELLPLAATTHMLLDPDLAEQAWLRTADTLRRALRPTSPP